MAKILIGTRSDGGPFETNAYGEPLYVDIRHRLLWAWLPPAAVGDYCGFEAAGSLELGPIDPTRRGLIHIPIERDQLKKIEAIAWDDPFLRSTPTAAETESIHSVEATFPSPYDYLSAATPETAVLRCLAWLAARHYDKLKPGDDPDWLRGFSWDDVINSALDGRSAPIQRDTKLFESVKRAVEARHLVFIVGGLASGLTIFLEQFRQFLAAQESAGSHLTADFNPDIFQQIFTYLEYEDKIGGLNGLEPIQPPTTALLISLAYSAYESIVALTGSDNAMLNDFVSPKAMSHPIVFVQVYTGQLGRKHGFKFQVEFFLSLLDKMTAAVGRQKKLTVLLSFPRLFKWLATVGDHPGLLQLPRLLWNDLQAFTNDNYDASTGNIKPNSRLSQLSSSVGILVEVNRLPLTNSAEAFCRRSVLTLPPFSDGEIRRLWSDRLGLDFENGLTELHRQTGGYPWFLDLLLSCVALHRTQTTMATDVPLASHLESGIQLAKTLITNGSYRDEVTQDLRARVDSYFNALGKILSRKTRLDRDALTDLEQGYRRNFLLSLNPGFEEWFESGLIWPRPPVKAAGSMLGFAGYPYGETYQIGVLPALMAERVRASGG